MAEEATNPDPEVGLAAVAALRALVDVLEALQVDSARARGWSCHCSQPCCCWSARRLWRSAV